MDNNVNQITKKCIIEEYLCNFFTYEELADYLVIDKEYIIDVLDNYSKNDKKLYLKIKRHSFLIDKYLNSNENETYNKQDLIVKMARYIIDNNASIRETAKYFNKGKTTVHEQIHEKLPDISIRLYKEVFDCLMEHKSFSVDNINVREQVLESYKYLKMGLTINEIQEEQHLSRNIVQRNLTTRLSKISNDYYQEAKRILESNQLSSLEEHKFRKK